MHPKAKLAEFLGKWRGRPVVPGESIDLAKLIGANCTLVISHQQNLVGRTYASIDAVSKPTKKLTASGSYDPAMARQRIAEWKAREASNQSSVVSGQRGQETTGPRTTGPQAAQAQAAGAPKSAAPGTAPEFDPEVGF